MAQNLMQDHLYGDLLTPTPGYHTDFAMGMTYSLGFDALLTAQLAFGMLGDLDDVALQTQHLLLSAIQNNRDRMVIFCNKGSIAVPPTVRKVYSLLENNIFEVFNPKNKTANFHPKMWLIREVNNDRSDDIILRLIVSSRNMAYSDAIDCVVELSGKIESHIIDNPKHRRLREFIEKVVAFSNLDGDKAKKVMRLAADLERVGKFEVSSPFDDYDFFPYLFEEDFGLGRVEDYLCGTESIVISPFIEKGFLDRINPDRKDHRALITRKEFVTPAVFDSFDSKGGVFVALDDLASRGMDLHAKMYLVWMGRDRNYLYLGSANATKSAFERNGEFLLRLKFEYGNSKFSHLMSSFHDKDNKDSKFIRLFEPIERPTSNSRWDEAELAMRALMCSDDLAAKITRHRDGKYSVVVKSSMKKPGSPIHLEPLHRQDLKTEWRGRAVFNEMVADELSEFYVMSSTSENGTIHRAVFRIKTEGMPNDRDASIFRSIIKTPTDFNKYLDLMLSDTPLHIMAMESIGREKGNSLASPDYSHDAPHVLERLMKVSSINPKKIIQIEKIVRNLDADTVSEEFIRILKYLINAIKLAHK